MAVTYRDDDADLGLVQARNVAVLGYDDLAAATALCLRDSGVDVRVGLERDAAEWAAAESDGLRVVTTYEACEEADLMVLPPRSAEDARVVEAVGPNLVPGDVVVLQEAAAKPANLPAGVDVVRLAPWAPGAAMREEFTQGRGVPIFASVVVDGSGEAWAVALAFARAIGATRAGVLRVGDTDLAQAHTHAEVTLLRGGVLPLVRAAFESLVESGCQPELAFVRCFYGLRRFADELVRGTLDPELAAVRTSPHPGRDPDPLPAAADLVRSLMAWERTDEPRLH